MPAERLAMRKIHEILRLRWACCVTGRQTARACRVSHSTVLMYEHRAREAGLRHWSDVSALDDVSLERALFPPGAACGTRRPLPEWSEVHAELHRPGVTLHLLWEEYKAAHPAAGLQYSRYCDLYRAFRGRLDLSMRQTHKAGEKLFVDYCGPTVSVMDPETGESRSAQIFVAVLGASNYTYAEATWTQQLVDWTGSHERALTFFGGVPEIIVPDNLKSGVTHACRYEPELNPTYQDLATHYDVAVIPARARRPKDKAKVETGVLVVERWILACLRRRQFFSLEELNVAIRALLERLNSRPFQKLAGCRRSRFEALDQPVLRPLPQAPFEYSDWLRVRVRSDYHVEIEGHYYSVPYQLVGEQLEARLTAHGVECLHRSRRVACHARSREIGGSTTLREHMPRAHQEYADWTPQRLLAWAHEVGEQTGEMVEQILSTKPHPLQGFHSALGLRKLAKRYGKERLEAACARGLRLGTLSFTSLRSMLKHGLEGEDLPPEIEPVAPLEHGNVRGADYYRQAGDATPC